MVNWCPQLGTALANEEVIDGKSERGGFPVHRKPLKQWMFRITAYAERLLNGLEGLDWPESTRTMQTQWIGRSEGANIDFPSSIRPTRRPDSSCASSPPAPTRCSARPTWWSPPSTSSSGTSSIIPPRKRTSSV